MDRKTSLIVITGPTCAGKTDLALSLSKEFDIEVVSADSMQVYRHMDIATAKPSSEELSVLPHHLIDVVNPDEQFQAGMFVQLAAGKIREIRKRKRVPVVVGGTGLYIKALIYGLASAPGRWDQLRDVLKESINTRGIEYLEKMLGRLDPALLSRIRKNDVFRIIRSLEIIFQTGQPASEIYSRHGFEKPLYEARIACIMPDRGSLYRKIDTRVLKMIEKGLVEETRSLLGMGYSPDLSSMQTLAYRHIIHHLDGSLNLDEAVDLIQRDTRRFAKRQITWMKSRSDHIFFDSPEKAAGTVSSWIESAAG